MTDFYHKNIQLIFTPKPSIKINKIKESIKQHHSSCLFPFPTPHLLNPSGLPPIHQIILAQELSNEWVFLCTVYRKFLA